MCTKPGKLPGQDHRKGVLRMQEETEVAAYEPPTVEEAGDFAEVTLGRPSWGFEADWTCVMLC